MERKPVHDFPLPLRIGEVWTIRNEITYPTHGTYQLSRFFCICGISEIGVGNVCCFWHADYADYADCYCICGICEICVENKFSSFLFLPNPYIGYFPWIHGKFLRKGEGKVGIDGHAFCIQELIQ